MSADDLPETRVPPTDLTEAEVTERMAAVALEASTCPRCDLALTRNKVVFGAGNPHTPLVFVGEGPGENEDATGEPFVGRAGKLLDKALAANQMSRKHIYICNTVKCRPTIVEGSRVRNRPPSAGEMDACRPWLLQQLDLIRPCVIVCLGAPAANTIIHKGFKMTQERGKFFESPYAETALAAFHPAYVLRLHGDAYETAFASLVNDIAAARDKAIELKRARSERPVPASDLAPTANASDVTPEAVAEPTQLSLFEE